MQRWWLILSLLGPFIIISAALPTLETVNTSLHLLENDNLATKRSNNTLQIDPNTFLALNASSNQIELKCHPYHSPLARIVMDDYYGAVNQILVREDATIPRQWVLGPIYPQHVEWREGTCRIILMARTTILTPPFPVIWAAHAAALVVKECITEARGYWAGKATLTDVGNAVVWVGAYREGMDGPTAQM
ncbi:hypothetical protein BDR22DRAFT_5153 [Usnea florida]